MNTTPYEDLIQLVLDGAATPEEEARLQAALEGDAHLRNQYQELQRLFGILESVGEVEPPPGAMEEVQRQVQQFGEVQGLSSHRAHRGWLGAGWEALRRHLSPQLAYAFATGAIASAALFIGLEGPALWLAAPGTIHWIQPLEEARIMDAVVLEAPGSRAQVRAGDYTGTFFVEIECDLSTSGTLEVHWEDPLLAVVQAQRDRPEGELALLPEVVRFAGTGENRYRLWFSGRPAGTLRVRLVSGDVTREATLGTQTDF